MDYTKRDFRGADFDELAGLVNRFYPTAYAVDSELLRFNSVDSPTFDWGASVIAERKGAPVAMVIVKKSPSKLYGVVDGDQYHLSTLAFDDGEVCLDLMAAAKQILRDRGASKLVFGQDSRHFFPGCPTDAAALHGFLVLEGFSEGSESCDLERDLKGFKSENKPQPGAEYRFLKDSEQKNLDQFFRKNFPNRWRYDVMSKAKIEGVSSTVFALLLDGAVQGFALLQDWTHHSSIGGAVWKKSLGDNWGSLGPIGVAENLRGRGYGIALLSAALEALAEKGVERCIIDWTNLKDFYGKVGFVPTRTYKSMSLSLDFGG